MKNSAIGLINFIAYCFYALTIEVKMTSSNDTFSGCIFVTFMYCFCNGSTILSHSSQVSVSVCVYSCIHSEDMKKKVTTNSTIMVISIRR